MENIEIGYGRIFFRQILGFRVFYIPLQIRNFNSLSELEGIRDSIEKLAKEFGGKAIYCSNRNKVLYHFPEKERLILFKSALMLDYENCKNYYSLLE